jgi:transaldolase
MTNMRRLLALGQSAWLDDLSRAMTRSGELHTLIADGLRGMTSNPTIFEHAIGHASDYERELTELANSTRSDREIFEALAIEDVQEAADVFRAVFDSTAGGDGFVSGCNAL